MDTETEAVPAWLNELDRLYSRIDKLYYEVAHACGVSSCAYWMLYDLDGCGGATALRKLCGDWSYSKQTINSAIKSLEAKGFIALDYEPGSRKNKTVCLTEAGRAFVERYVRPAKAAEERAFCTLEPEERAMLLALSRKFANAIDAELQRAIAVDFARDDEGERA